jgi:hypothetical protein
VRLCSVASGVILADGLVSLAVALYVVALSLTETSLKGALSYVAIIGKEPPFLAHSEAPLTLTEPLTPSTFTLRNGKGVYIVLAGYVNLKDTQ